METKNKIVRYSERLQRTDAFLSVEHYDKDCSEYHSVDGVYVGPKFYLRTCTSLSYAVTQQQAVDECKKHGGNFPANYELLLLGLVLQAVKKSLSKNWINLVVPAEDIFNKCWTRENMEADDNDHKYLLLFGYDDDCEQPQNFPKTELIGKKYALVEEKYLFEPSKDSWQKCSLQLLSGDKLSNLLLTDTDDLFLQKEQKLSYIGRCKEIRNDEIIVCDTGIFQYVKGEVRCLLKIDVSREEYSNSNCGHEEWADIGEVSEGGTVLVCEYKEYDWCDNGEQIRNYAVERRFEKDEQGLFQPL